ncbi:hypothetical protein A0H81_02240 [Grifola frondosa]|uniref:Uncharacterized protein n=1 Tax=Grifola frondosa TaxID=5627 RepID=A0A1C7MNC7_GRIFR|nr:hypothetical protein A0H81_02240 [Grifola frondosa]
MTRQLWDIKRQITALKAREDILAGDLQRLNSGQNIYTLPIQNPDIPEERLQEQEEQIAALRAELNREIAARRAAEAAANEERARRVHAEGVLDDTRREYSTPFVVPALMEAFFKLAQLSSDGILDTELDYGAHSNALRR